METERLSYGGAPVAEAFSLMVQSSLLAHKSICCLLFLIRSLANNADALTRLIESEKRFPFSDLHNMSSPDAECKDDGETDDDSDDDNEDSGGDDDSDDDDTEYSSGEDDDEQGDPDSDSDANDDDDDDDDEDDDDDDDDDEDDDDEDDEDEDNQPPFKKIK